MVLVGQLLITYMNVEALPSLIALSAAVDSVYEGVHTLFLYALVDRVLCFLFTLLDVMHASARIAIVLLGLCMLCTLALVRWALLLLLRQLQSALDAAKRAASSHFFEAHACIAAAA